MEDQSVVRVAGFTWHVWNEAAARHVWKVAAVPKCGPLDDKTAEALGKDLDWAICFRKTAGSSLSLDTRDLIQQIENTARKLERLLTDTVKTDALHMIEQVWPDPSNFFPLEGIQAGLAELCKAAGRFSLMRLGTLWRGRIGGGIFSSNSLRPDQGPMWLR